MPTSIDELTNRFRGPPEADWADWERVKYWQAQVEVMRAKCEAIALLRAASYSKSDEDYDVGMCHASNLIAMSIAMLKQCPRP